MKNPKLGFCRVSLGLFCHEKILVNKCWLKVWNFWSKFENPPKNSRFYWEDKHPGGFFYMVFKHMICGSNESQWICFDPIWTILSYHKNWGNDDFLKFDENENLAYFYTYFLYDSIKIGEIVIFVNFQKIVISSIFMIW